MWTMPGEGQCCRIRQSSSSSPGIPSSDPHTDRKSNSNNSINKKRSRKIPRFAASAALMAGATMALLMMVTVENGMSGVFAHWHEEEEEEVTRAGQRALRPFLREHYAPSHEGAAGAARRTLQTEVEISPGVKFTGKTEGDGNDGRYGDKGAKQVGELGGGHGSEEGNGMGEAQSARGQEEEEEEEEKGEGGPGAVLPQCYSSAAADPSEGAWRECENGADDSPTDMFNWAFSDREFGRSPGCSKKWAEQHPGEGPMPFYEWEAEHCSLDTVDADKFCRVMEGRKGMLFVGDSLTRLMCTTLASTLRAVGVVAGSDQRCHDEWLACDGALKIHYQRNDFLDTRTERLFENNTRGFDQKHCERPDLSKTRCTIFADDETLSGFDTLVVNSGAHPRPGERYGPAMEVASQTIAASMKRLHGDEDTILVVRNTVPGHTDCDDRMFKGPVDLDTALALVDAAPESYKFSTFHDNNKLLEEAFLGDPSDGWRLIDSYTPTVLRPDLHRGGNDCLHYCIPGPTDHWVRLLYNMLVVATGNDAGGGEPS